ncbi:MAG: IS982 family transposase, partial [Truepera sp.]|nr:IS982 family transposase [Truepera sp.]
ELFLTVFVYIDDWLKPYQDLLPQQSAQKASYSELLTIAVVGEILAQPFESNWYWIVNQLFSELFPRLPHYSRYHRILRNAERLLAELALSVLGDSRIHLIDSKPLPVAKGKRSSWSKFPGARKGFSTMGMVFGFKLHALTNLNGLFERWAFAAANHPDVRLARELTEGLEEELVLGDKAYIGSDVLTPKRSNMKGDEVWTESLDRTRKRIEASFSTLVRSLTLHATQVKTFLSLRTRVNLKIAAFNLLYSGVLFR